MPGEGPFLWFSEKGSPWGYQKVPPGGFCIGAFLFVRRGDEILLGRYANDPAWERLAGLDEPRRLAHGQGWTLPASHLKYGEDPRAAGRRIAEEILRLPRLVLGEPRVEVDLGIHPRFPEVGPHADMWFFLEARVPEDFAVEPPPWFTALSFHDPKRLKPSDFGRSHEDVLERWMAVRGDA